MGVVAIEGVAVLIYCLLTAGLGLFLQECYKGILRRYYLMLNFFWIKNWRKKDRWKRRMLPPLGLCLYCQTAWINGCLYFFIFDNFLLFVLSFGGIFLFLKTFDKWLE